MSNRLPPRGNRPPSKNISTPNSNFLGSKPPIDMSQNAHTGYTWRNRNQNPLSPEFTPPKSSPVSKLPPKLPPASKAGLGLGKMAAGAKAGLPGLGLMLGLMLLESWLDQPAPPPPSPGVALRLLYSVPAVASVRVALELSADRRRASTQRLPDLPQTPAHRLVLHDQVPFPHGELLISHCKTFLPEVEP